MVGAGAGRRGNDYVGRHKLDRATLNKIRARYPHTLDYADRIQIRIDIETEERRRAAARREAVIRWLPFVLLCVGLAAATYLLATLS